MHRAGFANLSGGLEDVQVYVHRFFRDDPTTTSSKTRGDRLCFFWPPSPGPKNLYGVSENDWRNWRVLHAGEARTRQSEFSDLAWFAGFNSRRQLSGAGGSRWEAELHPVPRLVKRFVHPVGHAVSASSFLPVYRPGQFRRVDTAAARAALTFRLFAVLVAGLADDLVGSLFCGVFRLVRISGDFRGTANLLPMSFSGVGWKAMLRSFAPRGSTDQYLVNCCDSRQQNFEYRVRATRHCIFLAARSGP